ncbi:MAG: acetate--CoA ligase family protein, partial [Hyphomicrobiales bacterium]|nr:acetate--CoA ligase family protein [Hyphomicrobiales bacterium]
VSIVADSAIGRRVDFPPLSESRVKAVEAALGPGVTVANPFDYHTYIWNDEAAMTATFSAFIAGGFDLNFLGLDFPRTDRCSDVEWWSAVDSFDAALKPTGAKGAILATLPENMPEQTAALLFSRGLAPMAGIDEALAAAECAADIGAAWQKPVATPVIAASRDERQASEHPVALDEAEAKSLLAAAGLSVPSGRRVETAMEAVEAARSIGFPVALKALGLAHKSEHGAVRLGLGDEAGVLAAANDLAPLGSGLFVERMVGDGVAELIVGITSDPQFGPVMTIGSGGVLVELIADSRTLLLSASRDDIEAALKALRLFPLLDGYRGRPRADVDAAIAAIEGIARFAADNAARVRELDINPLIVCATGKGAWIADALIVMEDDND